MICFFGSLSSLSCPLNNRTELKPLRLSKVHRRVIFHHQSYLTVLTYRMHEGSKVKRSDMLSLVNKKPSVSF